MVKNLPANAGEVRDVGSIPGSGRSPEGGHGNPGQYSCLENPWREEPGGLQYIGLQRIGHDEVTKHSLIIGETSDISTEGHSTTYLTSKPLKIIKNKESSRNSHSKRSLRRY